jgi:hypothetical protein
VTKIDLVKNKPNVALTTINLFEVFFLSARMDITNNTKATIRNNIAKYIWNSFSAYIGSFKNSHGTPIKSPYLI